MARAGGDRARRVVNRSSQPPTLSAASARSTPSAAPHDTDTNRSSDTSDWCRVMAFNRSKGLVPSNVDFARTSAPSPPPTHPDTQIAQATETCWWSQSTLGVALQAAYGIFQRRLGHDRQWWPIQVAEKPGRSRPKVSRVRFLTVSRYITRYPSRPLRSRVPSCHIEFYGLQEWYLHEYAHFVLPS